MPATQLGAKAKARSQERAAAAAPLREREGERAGARSGAGISHRDSQPATKGECSSRSRRGAHGARFSPQPEAQPRLMWLGGIAAHQLSASESPFSGWGDRRWTHFGRTHPHPTPVSWLKR